MNYTSVRAPLQAQIVEWRVAPGDRVRPGAVLLILEAMKMEHEVRAEGAGQVLEQFFEVGEAVDKGAILLSLAPDAAEAAVESTAIDGASGPSVARGDLQRWQARQATTLDAARPEAVAKRHALSLRTAR